MTMPRLLIVSDAWKPQVNGVVRTLRATKHTLEGLGYRVEVIGPDGFHTVPLPSYNEIRLAVYPARRLEGMITDFAPDAIHLATEGPLGWAGRSVCHKLGLPYTTAVHTLFPEYLARRAPVPERLSYAIMRRFHNASSAIMVATPSLEHNLARRGFSNLRPWTRGVDTVVFQPVPGWFADLPRPVMLYAGRVAIEKNIQAFLDLDLSGTKVVVGDGPQKSSLQKRYKNVVFTGVLDDGDLARAYTGADVFVFPSTTDTFGLVMAEALACGTPVAAFPAAAPSDILRERSAGTPVGVLDNDLGHAVTRALALDIPAARCRDFALRHYSWDVATAQFASIAFSAPCPGKRQGL